MVCAQLWLVLTMVSKLVRYDVGSSVSQSYPTLPDTPNHPPSSFNFPQREFGKKQVVKRSCQLQWFSNWEWLHYDEDDDVVFCHFCVTALVKRTVKWNKEEAAFVSKGYCNWKDAIVAFRKHEGSDCHKSAIEAIVRLPSQCKDIREQLSKQVASDKQDNQQCLLKVISNVRFLSRQGLAFLEGMGMRPIQMLCNS